MPQADRTTFGLSYSGNTVDWWPAQSIQLHTHEPLHLKYMYSYSHPPQQVDRTTMGLYYSGNAVDWWPAGVIDYHLDFAEHFTYPHMAVAGEDLLVVMRATAPPLNETATSKWCGF